MSEEEKQGARLIFTVKRFLPEELVAKHTRPRVPKRPAKSYQTTSDEQRFGFVQKIVRKELSIREAADVFGIRYSTAKTIMKVYKSEGRYEKKKHRLKRAGPKDPAPERGTSTAPVPAPAVPFVQPNLQEKSPPRCGARRLPDGFWALHLTAHMIREEPC